MNAFWRIAGYECQSLLRNRGVWLAWVLLLAAGWLAVVQGHAQMQAQREVIEQLPAIQQQDHAFLERRYAEGTDPGNIGYYLFHPVAHPPSDWASLATGMRDVLPYAMKVRMLGLYSQLFDAELVNPTAASAGSYDFALFLVVVLPIWLIVLCHGVLAREDEEGTGPLLRSQTRALLQILLIRIGLRYALALLACLLLMLAAVLWMDLDWDRTLVAWILLLTAYLTFWASLCCVTVALGRSSLWTAMTLLGAWTLLIVVAPSALATLTEQRHPMDDAALLMLDQRQAVHTGWDMPKETTFERFFVNHPQWLDTPPVTERFHWKWYFAMHQVADESIAKRVVQYQQQLAARERLQQGAAHWLPTVGAVRGFTGLAQSDLADHLAFLDSVADFHKRLRTALYPGIFNVEPIFPADFSDLPRHEPPASVARMPWGAALGMLFWSLLFLGLTRWRMAR